MRRLAVIGTLLALILAAGIFSLCWLQSYTNRLAGDLEAAAGTAETDPAQALEQLAAIEEDWSRAERKIGLFVHESPLRRIGEAIAASAEWLRLGEETEFRATVRTAAYLVRDLARQEMPTLKNIF